MNSFMIAPTAIINGLGQSIGIDVVKIPGTTGDYHTNLDLKAEGGIKCFENKEKSDSNRKNRINAHRLRIWISPHQGS